MIGIQYGQILQYAFFYIKHFCAYIGRVHYTIPCNCVSVCLCVTFYCFCVIVRRSFVCVFVSLWVCYFNVMCMLCVCSLQVCLYVYCSLLFLGIFLCLLFLFVLIFKALRACTYVICIYISVRNGDLFSYRDP